MEQFIRIKKSNEYWNLNGSLLLNKGSSPVLAAPYPALASPSIAVSAYPALASPTAAVSAYPTLFPLGAGTDGQPDDMTFAEAFTALRDYEPSSGDGGQVEQGIEPGTG